MNIPVWGLILLISLYTVGLYLVTVGTVQWRLEKKMKKAYEARKRKEELRKNEIELLEQWYKEEF